MNDESDHPPIRWPRALMFCAAAGALLLLLGRNALISSEGTLAECVREFMLGCDVFADGMWGGAPDAPGALFAARFTAYLANVAGLSEWIVRLPSALAALVMLAGTVALADGLFGRRTGTLAGWLMIGSYGFLFWGRHASWHMMPAAALVWTAALAVRPEKRFFGTAALLTLILTGILLWGWFFVLPLAAMTPLFRVGGFAASDWKVRIGAVLAALAATAAIVLLLTESYRRGIADGWQAFAAVEEQVWRSSRQVMIWSAANRRAWYESLENLPRLLLPWVPLTALALYNFWRSRRESTRESTALLWTAGLLVLLTGIFPGRRWQYQLSMLPAFTVLTAAGLAAVADAGWNRRVGVLMALIFTLLGSFCVAVPVTYPLWPLLLKTAPPLTLLFGVPLCGLLALTLLIFGRTDGALGRLSALERPWIGGVLAGVALGVALWCVTIPSLTIFRRGRVFWRGCGQVTRTLRTDQVVFAGGEPGHEEMFYLGLPENATSAPDPESFREHLKTRKTGPVVVLIRRRDRNRFFKAAQEGGWEFPSKPRLREGVPLRLWGKAESSGKRYELYDLESINYGGVSHAQ